MYLPAFVSETTTTSSVVLSHNSFCFKVFLKRRMLCDLRLSDIYLLNSCSRYSRIYPVEEKGCVPTHYGFVLFCLVFGSKQLQINEGLLTVERLRDVPGNIVGVVMGIVIHGFHPKS